MAQCLDPKNGLVFKRLFGEHPDLLISFLNASKVYGTQLAKGESFNRLQPVYTLAILNENYDHKTDEFYHRYQMTHRKNVDEVIEGIELIFVKKEVFLMQKWQDMTNIGTVLV